MAEMSSNTDNVPEDVHDATIPEDGGTAATLSATNPTAIVPPQASQHHSLKHHLLGPSLTKAGLDTVDQKKVSEIIYEASKGSKFFSNEEVKDTNLTAKIEQILKLKAQLEKLDLKSETRRADDYIAQLELSRDLSQYVVHIDCDAFYAAVEEIDQPHLKNVPMAVGVGVLTTCNYEARKYGCRSAMAGFVAKKLCPQLICVPLNFEKYSAKAREVRVVLAEYDPRFESSSIDEAYLNITEYCQSHSIEPEDAVQHLRDEVLEKCKISISAGIAPNAKIAKICSNKNKPNGQFRVPNDRNAVMSFIGNLPIRKVNGVGRVFERELQAIGVETCGDLYQYRAYLNRLFGEKAYQFLIQTHLGLGRTNVQPAEEYERKSVGTESTFRDISRPEDLRAKLRHTAEELEKDMARVEVKGRTLVLKVKRHTYEVFTRQVAPPKAINTADDLYHYSLPILAKLEKQMPDFRLRLMGLRCTHLVSTKKAGQDFFQKAPRPQSVYGTSNTTDGEGEWEVWPDAEFEEAARQEKQEEFEELERLSQEHEEDLVVTHNDDGNQNEIATATDFFSTAAWHEPFGTYKYGSLPNSPVKPSLSTSSSKPEGQQNDDKAETWNCPICAVSQPSDDQSFNAHVDLCLSRRTIREAVAEADGCNNTKDHDRVENGDGRRSASIDPDAMAASFTTSTRRTRSIGTGGKRKASALSRNGSTADGEGATHVHRQRKLFFA